MKTLKTVRVFYYVYSIYTLFVMLVSDYEFIHAFTGLVLTWIVYLSFSFGCSKQYLLKSTGFTSRNTISYPLSNISDWSSFKYLSLGLLSIICSFGAAKFYTGKGPLSIIKSLAEPVGVYSDYQTYVKVANIGSLSLSKIPFVLMLTYCFTILIWGCVGILCSGKKIKTTQYIFIIEIIVAILLFGISRGTNYELYIVFVTIAYCLINRANKPHSRLTMFIIGFLGVLVVIIFNIVVSYRGFVFENQICHEITYDSSRFFSRVFPLLTTIGLSVFRYLGWGIFSIGYVTNNVLTTNVLYFVSSLIPFGFQIFYNIPLDIIVRESVSVGYGWVPDYFSFVNIFGFPLFLFVLYLLGRIVIELEKADFPSLLKNMIGVYIYIELLSIPVGNFFVSTPLLLSALYVVFWYILSINRIHVKFRI